MTDWFKDWFSSEEYLTVYKHRNKDDAANLLKLILGQSNLKVGSSILDAACGAGRYSLLLAERGFDVYAFDLSLMQLKIAIKEAKEKNKSIKYFQSDIRNVCLKKKFDLILNVFTSFGYFSSEDQDFKFIKDAFNFMHNGSLFVFDFLNADYVENNLVDKSEKVLDNLKITENRWIENKRVNKKITIQKDDQVQSFNESVKLYNADILISKFQDIGYKLVEKYGDYNGSPFHKNTSGRFIGFFSK